MNFYPYGPFKIPKSNKGLISTDKDEQKSFWESIESNEEGLSYGIGCYIFAIKAAKGALPWYVGIAEKTSFTKECFTAHKIVHYNNAIAARKGTPLLILIPKFTNKDRFSKCSSNGHKDIQFLENILIGIAFRRNPNLMNIKDTKILREMVVPGIINSRKGSPSKERSELQRILGIN